MKQLAESSLLSSFIALLLGAGAAAAQERPAAAPAAAASASKPMDCTAGAMKRHDHAAERNAPPAKPMPCAPAEGASGDQAKKTKPLHDHAKFHKNQ